MARTEEYAGVDMIDDGVGSENVKNTQLDGRGVGGSGSVNNTQGEKITRRGSRAATMRDKRYTGYRGYTSFS